MLVTVAICTWNRSGLLDKTLSCMKAMRIPAGVDWELLIVDNNSSDDTQAVIARHAATLPIRGLVERKAGHSHARNCAVENARGELLVWTDDDVLVDPNWLTEYVQAAAAWPRATFFGGAIAPWYESPPPTWLTRNWSRLSGFYAVRELGNEIRPLAPGEFPYGASMAFRSPTYREFRFDTTLGHVGKKAKGGEETDVFERLRAAGHEGVWIGTAKVRHYIPTERLTKRFVWEYARRLWQPETQSVGQLWGGVPRWLIRQYIAACVRTRWAALRGASDWVEHFLRSAGLRGQIDFCRNRARADAV